MSSELVVKSLEKLTSEEWILLLASVGTRRKERPVDPVTVAQVFANTPWSDEEIARRFSVTPRQIAMFKRLLKLGEKEQELVRARKISIDQGVRLSSLKDPALRQLLVEVIINRALSADIVSQVIHFNKENPGVPIEYCINTVIKSKPKTRHVFGARIERNTSVALGKKAQDIGVSSSDLLKKIVEDSLSIEGSVRFAFMQNGSSFLMLTPKGWETLRRKCSELGVPLDEVVEAIAKLWLKANP